MKTKFMAVILLTGLLAITAFSQPEGRRHGKGKVFEKLNLTDQQKDQVEGLRELHQREMIDLKAELEKAGMDLKSISRKDDISRSEYLDAVKKVTIVKNTIAEKRANHRMDIYEKLTPEQKKMWAERPHHERKGKEFRKEFKRKHGGDFEKD